MNNFKKQLEDMFSTEEKIGIRDIDYRTGMTEEEFMANHPNLDFEGVSTLPNGKYAAICTNGADYVVEMLGEGFRYGFMVEDNPSVTEEEIIAAEGHDFAVIRHRYIVDLWISHFTGCDSQVVYDLYDARDQAKIKKYFGDPSCWSCYDHQKKIEHEPKHMPVEFSIRPKTRGHDEGPSI